MTISYKDAVNYWTDNGNFPEMENDLKQDYDIKKKEDSCSTSAFNAKRMNFEQWVISETEETLYCQRHDI